MDKSTSTSYNTECFNNIILVITAANGHDFSLKHLSIILIIIQNVSIVYTISSTSKKDLESY